MKRKISVLIVLTILLQGLWVFSDVTYPMTTSPFLIDVATHLGNHQVDEAYDLLLQLVNKEMGDLTDQDYLFALDQLTRLELQYNKQDQSVAHAVTLFELASQDQNMKFQVHALHTLAFFDYSYYENAKMADKLNQSLVLLSQIDDPFAYANYYYGVALLAIDQSAYTDAIGHLDQALSYFETDYAYQLFDMRSKVYIEKAYVYFLDQNTQKALEVIQQALKKVDQEDTDAYANLLYEQTLYLYELNQLEAAHTALLTLKEAFQRTSQLYRTPYRIKAVTRIEADIAYGQGDFQKAADLYFNLSTRETNQDEVLGIVNAQETADQFEYSNLKEQVTLLEQLKEEQKARISEQSNAIFFAFIMIILLMVIVILVFVEIRTRTKQRQVFYEASITDQLTQIANRRFIIDRLENLKTPSKCIALLDVDNFKHINDHYGHQVGDEVLVRLAHVIKDSIRNNDQVGRYGGEEFLIILDTTDKEQAYSIAERVRMSIASLEWTYPGLVTTASLGMVLSDTQDIDDLLSQADHLLYEAKAHGKNRIVLAT